VDYSGNAVSDLFMPKSIIIKPIEIKLVFSVYLFHYNVYLWSSKDPDRISA
jgi:hypothetical protein